MDRSIIYELEQIRSFDTLEGWRDPMIGLGRLAQSNYGSINTHADGFTPTQTVSPSLTINLASGAIYSYSVVDAAPYGGLDGDSSLIVQQGYYAGGQLTIIPQLSAGQSQWILIQCKFMQVDAIRAGDPDDGILPYVNVDDPTQPLEGPNGSNVPQNTVRKGVAVISAKLGAAATTGFEVPPSADADNAGLFLIHINYGQTTITTGQILVAGPNAYANYPVAPFFPGVTGTIPGAVSGSHHGGVLGQGNKILLTNGAEVTGIAPFANLPVSNSTPPSVGGHITMGGEIPVIYFSDINPSGNLAGSAGDFCVNTLLGFCFTCTSSGSSSTAVWLQVGNPGSVVVPGSFPLTPLPSFIYLCNTNSGDQTVQFTAASTYGGIPVTLKNIGTNNLVVLPAAGERFEQQAANAQTVLGPTDALKFAPQSGYGWWMIP